MNRSLNTALEDGDAKSGEPSKNRMAPSSAFIMKDIKADETLETSVLM